MNFTRRFLSTIFGCLIIASLSIAWPTISTAQARAFEILWWNANPDEPRFKVGRHRETMANYLDTFQGGALFNVTYGVHRRGGDLANVLGGRGFDVVILDATETRSRFNGADLEALKALYAAGRSNIMLDGTLNIRYVDFNHLTDFPGVNGSSAGLLVNQVAALARRGGGFLIGTDHDRFQVSANAAATALVPGARFSGTTNPSTDGDFLGRSLLGEMVPVRANDVLQHWQTIPNQGQAPVGQFTDILGRPVTFYSLVEAADKPGGSAKRPLYLGQFRSGFRTDRHRFRSA